MNKEYKEGYLAAIFDMEECFLSLRPSFFRMSEAEAVLEGLREEAEADVPSDS